MPIEDKHTGKNLLMISPTRISFFLIGLFFIWLGFGGPEPEQPHCYNFPSGAGGHSFNMRVLNGSGPCISSGVGYIVFGILIIGVGASKFLKE